MTARQRFPSDDRDQFQFRLPTGMRDAIKRAADSNGRSMNAEIIHRLKREDPAEGAASPGQGSTCLSKGITMNDKDDITTAERKPISYSDSLNKLEHAIQSAELCGLTADYLVEDAIGMSTGPYGARLDETQSRIISHTVLQTSVALREVSTAFFALQEAIVAETRR